MRRKKFWFLIIGALIVIAGFFIYLFLAPEPSQEEWVEIGPKFEEPQYYELQETEEGTFLVNKHAGFSLKVPDGWKVEKEQDAFQTWQVVLSDPQLEMKEHQLTKGCLVAAHVEYDEYNYNYLVEKISNPLSLETKEEKVTHKVIQVDNVKGYLRSGSSEEIGEIIYVEIPYKPYAILVLMTRVLPNSSYCKQALNQIINDISFDNLDALET